MKYGRLGLTALFLGAMFALSACGLVGGIGNGKVSPGCAFGGHCTTEDFASIKEGQNLKSPESLGEVFEAIFVGQPSTPQPK